MTTILIEHQTDSMKVTKRVYTPEGYLILYGQSSEEGVLDYPELGMSQFVPQSTLAQSDSLFEGYPLSVEHPGKVTAKNWRAHGRGTILSAETSPQGKRVIKMIIHDAKTIKLIEDEGLQYLSEAYEVQLAEQPGEHKGKPYQYVQTSRRPNHIALTKNPRAGTKGAFLMDSSMADPVPPQNPANPAPPSDPTPPADPKPPQFDMEAWAGQMTQMTQANADAIKSLADAILKQGGGQPTPDPKPPVSGPPASPQMDSKVKALVAQRVALEKAAEGLQLDSLPEKDEELAAAILKARGVEVEEGWSMDIMQALLKNTRNPTQRAWRGTKRTLNTDSAPSVLTVDEDASFDTDDSFFN